MVSITMADSPIQTYEWAGLREDSGRKQATCSNQDESSASRSRVEHLYKQNSIKYTF